MHVEAERGEEGDEEGFRGLRIRHPDGLPGPELALPAAALQRRHHPVLDAVLAPDPARGRRPRGETLAPGAVRRGGHHGDVDARGEVVHEDAERRGRRALGGAEVEEDAAGGGGGAGGGEIDDGGGEREDEEQEQRAADGHRAAARRGHHDAHGRRRPRAEFGARGRG